MQVFSWRILSENCPTSLQNRAAKLKCAATLAKTDTRKILSITFPNAFGQGLSLLMFKPELFRHANINQWRSVAIKKASQEKDLLLLGEETLLNNHFLFLNQSLKFAYKIVPVWYTCCINKFEMLLRCVSLKISESFLAICRQEDILESQCDISADLSLNP